MLTHIELSLDQLSEICTSLARLYQNLGFDGRRAIWTYLSHTSTSSGLAMAGYLSLNGELNFCIGSDLELTSPQG